MSDLFKNHIVGFFHEVAHICSQCSCIFEALSCKNHLGSAIIVMIVSLHLLVAPVAEWLRALIFRSPFDHLTAVFGVGSSPTRGICETSQVLLVDVSGVFFPGFSHFCPIY